MNDKWKDIVDAASEAIPDDVESAEKAMAMVLRNVVAYTAVECAKACESVQVKENGVAIVGKHQQMKYVKAIRDHFGLGELQ